MQIKKQHWDIAEDNFRQWVDTTADEAGDIFTNIYKSFYFLFRRTLREQIQDLFTNYYDNNRFGEIELNESEQRYTKRDYGIRFSKRRRSEEESNEQLLYGITNGDQHEFNNFYEKQLPVIVQMVRNNSGTVEQAQDVFQEGLIVLIEKYYQNKLNLSCSVSTYFYSICRNIWMNQLRAEKRLRNFIDDNKDLYEEISFLTKNNIPEVFEKIETIINSFGEPCKELLERYYYLNHTWGDIAKELGYANAASARNQKYKCLERIRKQLGVMNH